MSSSHGEGLYTMDASGAAWLLARQAASDLIKTNSTALLTAVSNRTSTQLLIQELRFASAKSIRNSTITLAIFNTVAALATVLGILWENYSREKKTKGYSIRRDGINFVSGSDVYPLFLSLGIMVQGIIFAVAQSSGLDNLFTAGCTTIAQSMLPALILVPVIQLVFGLEVMFRGMRSKPFPKRGPWSVRLCLIFVILSCIGALVVTQVAKSPDFCFASLFWFVAHYALGSFIVLLIITVVLFGAAVVVFLRLSRNASIDDKERVGASRMVYYMALAVISNALIVPFFQQLAFEDQRDTRFSGLPLTLSMVASVVTEVSGLMTGCLYLFLRSNTLAAIGSKLGGKDSGHEKLKSQIYVRASNADQEDSGITSPNGLRRMDSDASMISHYAKDEEAGMSTRLSPTYANQSRSNDDFPKAPEPSYASRTSRRFKASSIFSAMRPLSTRPNAAPLLPATTYTPNAAANSNSSPTTTTNTAVKPHRFDFSSLKPPPSMKNLGGSRHRRESSIASHLTVQLGLRLSNMGDIGRPGEGRDSCTEVITLVDQTREPNRPAQQNLQPPEQPKQVLKPSPLAQAINIVPDDDDVEEVSLYDSAPTQTFLPAKAMQPIPKPVQTIHKLQHGQPETLSPMVYSPAGSSPKMVSPRGVGFTTPPMSRYNSQSTQRSASQRSTASQRSQGPPPRRPSTASKKPPQTSDKGSEWI